MDLGQLQSLLTAVSGVRVACVGDVMVDRFVYGEVSRTSPEAPIPSRRKKPTPHAGTVQIQSTEACASQYAAAAPEGPAPTTRASQTSGMKRLSQRPDGLVAPAPMPVPAPQRTTVSRRSPQIAW